MPPFAFSRALALALLYGGDEAPMGSDLAEALLYLFFSSTFLGVSGIFLHMYRSSAKIRGQISGACGALVGAPGVLLSRGDPATTTSHDGDDGDDEERQQREQEQQALRRTGGEEEEEELDDLVAAEMERVRSGGAAADPNTAILLEVYASYLLLRNI